MLNADGEISGIDISVISMKKYYKPRKAQQKFGKVILC